MFAIEDKDLGVEELTRRLELPAEKLRATNIAYQQFTIPKKSGGQRKIITPGPALKDLQQRILRRLLGRLHCHPLATGFERGHSIVTNACCHVNRAVVVRMDLKDFFETTTADRVKKYFRAIGWNMEASDLITKICVYHGRGLHSS